LTDFQPSFLCELRQALLGTPGAKQRAALRSETLFGDRHELLKPIVAGLAKELDRARESQCAVVGLTDSGHHFAAWQRRAWRIVSVFPDGRQPKSG